MKDAIGIRRTPGIGRDNAAVVGRPNRCGAAGMPGASSIPGRCGVVAQVLAVALMLVLTAPPLDLRAQAAAGWDVSLMVDPFPPPFLSDWEMNPQIASLTISRTSGADAWVTIHFMVTRGDGRMVVSARSEPQLVVAGIPTVINTGSAVGGSSEYDTSVEDVIARTARFPEDDYTACVVVADASGFVVADQICANFSTFYPDPPYLLFPMDGDTVARQDLFFDWTPLQLPVSVMPRFVVQIAEIGVGQTPRQALTSNILHFEDRNLLAPGLQYPLGEQSLNQGRRYAWWVQALDRNGMPLSSNDGRSEIWTFTLFDPDGGTPPGEEIGGSTHARFVPDGSATGPLANFGARSYDDMKKAFEDFSDPEMVIPLPIANVGSFQDLYLSNVRLEWEDASTALAITATASLPMGSVNLLLLADWESGDEAAFSLGVQPVGLDLSQWGGGGDSSGSAPDLDGAVLTIAGAARTLDPALLPEAVGRLYGNAPISLEAGVALHHLLDLRDTEVGRQLEALGLEVSEAELAGTVALDPVALFAEVSEPPSFDLTATLRGARLADTPEWLAVERYALRVTNEPALAFSLEVEAEAELEGQTLPFVLAADVGGEEAADDVVFTGRMASSWDAPMGIEWLALDSVRLTLTVPQGDGPLDAALDGVLVLGEQPVALTVEIEDAGGALAATFSAHVDELDVGDFLAFAESSFGSAGFAEGIPDDVARLSDVSLVFRSGDPPSLTVLATASALGQSTELAYTLLPPGTVGDGAAGMLGLRLSDWSLSGLIPALSGTIADFRFPQVAFIQGPDGVPAPVDPGVDEDDAAAGGGWSIPWSSFDPSFLAFLEPSHPCAGGTGCGGGAPGEEDASALSVRPGLNFSAPVSWAQVSGAFGGLFGGGSGGNGDNGGNGGDADDAAGQTVVRGSPGVTLPDLFSGNLDLTGLLDLRAVLPPVDALPFGWPDWLVPTERALEIAGDPTSVVARMVFDAELDGAPRTFDLAADLTSSEGGGAEFEGTMRGGWEQPFGLDWLVLDSVHLALAAGSVGPRVALGSALEIGTVPAALALDVRGTSEERVVHFTASARELSTVDVVDFLNDAFGADLGTPLNPVTLDSFTVAFNTGDAASFHLTGGFSADMEPMATLTALADLLPGVTAPAEVPFEIGTLAGSWFDLHVEPDSAWGGFGGEVTAGGTGAGSPRLAGSASIRVGGARSGDDEAWMTLELDVAARELSASEAIAALGEAVPRDWALPGELDIELGLDSVRVRLELDTRARTASADFAGSGRYAGPDGELDASLRLGLFDEDEVQWATGAVTLELQDVLVSAGVAQAAALLPGELTLPAALDSVAPVRLDAASLTASFDSRSDSVTARLRGSGSLGAGEAGGSGGAGGSDEGLEASVDLIVTRVAADSWAIGSLDARIGTMSVPEALRTAATLFPVAAALPEAVEGLAPLVLDSAVVTLGFDTRSGTFQTRMAGASHLGEGQTRLDGNSDISLFLVGGEHFASGSVTLGVRELPVTALLEEAGSLLGGEWTMPEGLDAFGSLHLDSARLLVGFDTERDSVSAVAQGSGRLGDEAGAMEATADIAFARLAGVPGAAGSVMLTREAITMTEALAQVAALLPGDWRLPDDLDAFDAVALDSARFELGFDSWADSLFAGVSGSGRLGDVAADARIDFLQGATADRASGLVTLNVGQVGAGDAVEQIAELLPGEWNLPAGFSSFNALQLDDAALHAGFETGRDSLWAGFQGSGRLNELTADASLGFGRAGGASFGNGLVTLTLGDVSLDEAFTTVGELLPGDWPAPDVDFDIGDLRRVQLALGFDTSADSVWAGIDADARLAERDGRATLVVVTAGGASGTARSSVTGTFRMDVGDVTLPGALALASSLVPGSPQVPTLDFDLGGLNDAVVEAGFRVAERDSAWAGLNGGFRLGQRTGRADVSLALGEGSPEGRFTAAFDDRFAVADVLDLLSPLLPGGGVNLPPLGPFDVGIDDALLTMSLGERGGLSFGGRTEMFGKSGDALFSAARIDGRTQFLFGVQVPDLGFGDIVPGLENPLTDALELSLAALTLTNGEGRVDSSELSPEERRFYAPMKGGGDDDFTMDFRPGLNLTGLLPLGDGGALKDMVDMLAPGASNLTLEGTLPLPGSGGGIRSLELRAALPPMAPPGKPAWFVEGQVAFAITGRPSVGVAGAITLDVEGDTLTFDVESNIAIIPAGGVELSLAGGLSALHPWEGPLGIEWLTLNEIRLALGLSPINVRLGFLGDAVIGSKDLRVALGTRLNLYTGVPTGAIVAGASEEGMSLGDVADFQSQVRGGDATLPVNQLPDMAIRDLDLKVATYADPDIDVKAGITFKGALLLQLAPQGELDEFGRIELEIDREGITGLGRVDAFSMGPVHFDSALVDLALTLPEQHLILRGGVTVDGGFAADIDLMMTRDSLSFASEVELFERFKAEILARAAFDLTNPTFQVHAEMSNDFSDEVLLDVFEGILPIGRTSLNAATVLLDEAEETLVLAEGALDEAIRVATESTLFTMNAAYEFYRLADNGYRYANSKYAYHRSRCSWRAPAHCTARDYWAGVRATRLVQRNNRWNIYQAARAAYLNRDEIENLPPVRSARTAMDEARSVFNIARNEVEKKQSVITGMEEWLDVVANCSDCPRPAIPLNIRRASFDAALEGFWGGSSVQLDVDFLVFGEQRRFQAGFGGSVSDLASSLGERLIDAIF